MGRSALTAIATFAMAIAAGPVSAVTVATPENGILWQTARDPSQPIQWRWEGDDVTSARVTIASPMDKRTFAPVAVARTGGSLYGSIEMPGGRVAGKEGDRIGGIDAEHSEIHFRCFQIERIGKLHF